jgi:deoxyadenosine/deoxycytidine kinase
MGKLVTIVGASGVGKTSLVRALSNAYPFQVAFEEHAERPFQTLFKSDPRYALANQIDYLLRCAEQERALRKSPQIGLMDGGLDLDFHGFTRLFHKRGLLTDAEFDLCQRTYTLLRGFLPPPELIVRLCADEITVANRLAARERINIASAGDFTLFNVLLDAWLASIPPERLLQLDVSNEPLEYEQSIHAILRAIQDEPGK